MHDTVLRKNIHWVGYVDWDVRSFHGYTTSKGSTYNSYLIKDKKIAIIDSVKAPYSDYLIANIKEIIQDLSLVDYVICNHAEPDHSGSIPVLMKHCINAELVCNEKCKKILGMHYNTDDWKFKIVNESTSISLGHRSLSFINTPMAHWPESMATYVPEEKILFSMDAFGQHYASSGRFDYEVNLEDIMTEARKYYANIIMLYSNPVKSVLHKAEGIDIEMIAPSHGVIWEKHVKEIINAYKEWTEFKCEPKVVIFFDTMWRSTALMADAIYKGAHIDKVIVRKFDLKYTNLTEIATEVLDAAVIAVGSPTLNRTMMPTVASILYYLKGLAPSNKSAIAFGSYGWAKIGGQHGVFNFLRDMNLELLLDEPLQSKFVPTEEILEECRKAGELLAKTALEHCSNN